MDTQYAQALFNLSQKPNASAHDLVKRLVRHLEKTGRQKLLPRILREFRRIGAQAQTFGQELEVASEKGAASAAREAKVLGITADPVVNATLITGWRARAGSRLIDRSGKRALIDLYRHIARSA